MGNTEHMENINRPSLTREKLFIELAINTICINAIENKVRAVRSGYEEMTKMSAMPQGAIVRTMNFSKVSMRIAAALLILISSATVYKYVSVNSQSFYNRHFTAYELGTTRGESKPDLQAFTYQDANWLDVIAMNNTAPVKTNKSRFLAGVAEMELKQYPAAVELFQAIITNKTDDSFRDEAEYYSALAFLANHQNAQAMDLIHQIKANPEHKYYPVVKNMSTVDLKIIELKK